MRRKLCGRGVDRTEQTKNEARGIRRGGEFGRGRGGARGRVGGRSRQNKVVMSCPAVSAGMVDVKQARRGLTPHRPGSLSCSANGEPAR